MCCSGLAPALEYAFSESLQDLPDMQELITQVRSEKCSLQAAAILGEPPAAFAACIPKLPFTSVPLLSYPLHYCFKIERGCLG